MIISIIQPVAEEWAAIMEPGLEMHPDIAGNVSAVWTGFSSRAVDESETNSWFSLIPAGACESQTSEKAHGETRLRLQTVDTLFIRETFNPRSPGQEASSLMKNGHSGQWMNK